jgi:hypothetical protein
MTPQEALALVKLAGRFHKDQLPRVRDEHIASGAHRTRSERFPDWVPLEAVTAAEAMPVSEAEAILSPRLIFGVERRRSGPSSRAERHS